MKWAIGFLLFLTVVQHSNGLDFTEYCPNFVSDLSTCASTLKDLTLNYPTSVVTSPMNSEMITKICSGDNLSVLEDFYRCFYKMLDCLPSDVMSLLPGLDQSLGGSQYMCRMKDDIDFACTGRNDASFMSCFTQTLRQVTGNDILEATCSAYSKIDACIQTGYGSCPLKTAEVMKKTISYQKPMGCHACKATPMVLIISCSIFMSLINVFRNSI